MRHELDRHIERGWLSLMNLHLDHAGANAETTVERLDPCEELPGQMYTGEKFHASHNALLGEAEQASLRSCGGQHTDFAEKSKPITNSQISILLIISYFLMFSYPFRLRGIT